MDSNPAIGLLLLKLTLIGPAKIFQSVIFYCADLV